MFILYTKQRPYPTTNDFSKGHEERYQRRVLRVLCVDGVEYPVEAYDRINEHGAIIPPCVFEPKCRPKESMLRIRID